MSILLPDTPLSALMCCDSLPLDVRLLQQSETGRKGAREEALVIAVIIIH